MTLVLQGEVENHRELAARWGLADVRSARQLLVELLVEPVAGRPTRLGELRGTFAFVAWDQRRQTLLAGRDPSGAQPLYVLRHGSGELTLATQLGRLTRDPDARVMDRIGTGVYLAFGHTGPGLTAYEAVQKLSPGVLHSWRRATVGFVRTSQPFAPVTPGAAELQDALGESVGRRLGPGARVGTFLDGGVESTLLTCLASRVWPGLQSFTATFPEAAGGQDARSVGHNAALLGVEHHLVPTALSDLALAAQAVVRQHGEPLADPAALLPTHLALAAAGRVRTVLDVAGARELFGGTRADRVSARLAAAHPLHLPGRQRLSDRWGLRQTGRTWERRLGAVLAGGGFAGHAALRSGELPLLGSLDPRARADVQALTASGWRTSAQGAGGRSRAYDRDVLLRDRSLEGTAAALLLGGLQARLPFLDADVVAVAQLQNPSRASLQDLLVARLPGVQLPRRSAGPSLDVRSLVDRHFPEQVERQLRDPSSALSQWTGRPDNGVARRRASRSSAFAFRLAMLDHWQTALGHDVVWQR